MARRYKEIEELKSADGRRYRTNTIYPSVPEIKTGIFICCANPMFVQKSKTINCVMIFFI